MKYNSERSELISKRTLNMNPCRKKKISFRTTEDMMNLIYTMAEMAQMNLSDFLRYLVYEEHYRIIDLVRDGVEIKAKTRAEEERIYDQIMRSVV